MAKNKRVAVMAAALGLLGSEALHAAPTRSTAQIDRISTDTDSGARRPAFAAPDPAAFGWEGQIDLGSSLGKIEGEQAVLEALRPDLRQTGNPKRFARLGFGRDGKVVDCSAYLLDDTVPGTAATDAFSKRLCEVLQAKLTYIPMQGFIMPGPVGHVTLNLDFLDAPAIAVPVELTQGRAGVPVIVTRQDATSEEGECDLDVRRYDTKMRQALCALWSRTLALHNWRSSDGRPVRVGDRAAIYVKRPAVEAAMDIRLDLSRVTYAWRNNPVFEQAPASSDPLTSRDGRVEVRFSEDDYPSSALRSEASGSGTYEWRFGADGRIVSCRPIVSTGVSELDNVGCRIALRNARWIPSEPSTVLVGRPWIQRIVWRIPED